jgi:hypothetical protein
MGLRGMLSRRARANRSVGWPGSPSPPPHRANHFKAPASVGSPIHAIKNRVFAYVYHLVALSFKKQGPTPIRPASFTAACCPPLHPCSPAQTAHFSVPATHQTLTLSAPNSSAPPYTSSLGQYLARPSGRSAAELAVNPRLSTLPRPSRYPKINYSHPAASVGAALGPGACEIRFRVNFAASISSPP